ncbi:hypothetical protein ACFQY4_04255 [Catellatospora bangladeshensis]
MAIESTIRPRPIAAGNAASQRAGAPRGRSGAARHSSRQSPTTSGGTVM